MMRKAPVDQGTTATWNYESNNPQQQAGLWTQPNPVDGAWQTGALSSPTTNPDFAPARFTDPRLRPAGETSSAQRPDNPTIRSTYWNERSQNSATPDRF